MRAFSCIIFLGLLLNLTSCDVSHTINSSQTNVKSSPVKSGDYQTPQGYEYSGSYSTVAPELRAQYVTPTASPPSSYDSYPSGQVSSDQKYYSGKQEYYPQSQNAHDRGVILISKELQVPFAPSKGDTDSDGCEETRISNVNQNIQNDESSKQVIKTSNYEVRRPGIRKEFYDIEEKVVIKPAGSAIFELEHDKPHSSDIVNKHINEQQTYPQQTYPQQTYPQQTYPQQTYPQQTYPQETYPQQFADDESQYYPRQQPFVYNRANHGYRPFITQSPPSVPAPHNPSYDYNPVIVQSPPKPQFVPYTPTHSYNPVFPSTTITSGYIPPVTEIPCEDGSSQYTPSTPKSSPHEFSDEHDGTEHDEDEHDYESDAVLINPQNGQISGDNRESVDVTYVRNESDSNRDREYYRQQSYPNRETEDYRQQTYPNRAKEDYRQQTYPNSDEQDYRQQTYPNRERENYRQQTYPNRDKENYRQTSYPNEDKARDKEDYRQQTYPNSDRQDYRQQTYPNREREDYRQQTYPNRDTENYRQTSYANQDKEDYRQQTYPNSDRQDYQQQTYPNREREDYRQQTYPNRDTENYRQTSYANQDKEDYRQQTYPNRDKEDYRQQTYPNRDTQNYGQQTYSNQKKDDYRQQTSQNSDKEDYRQNTAQSSVYSAPDSRIDRVRSEYRNERGDLAQQKLTQYPQQFHHEYVPDVNQNQVQIRPNGAPLAKYTEGIGSNQAEVENSQRLIDLYSANGDVTEIGFNGNVRSQQYQVPNNNVQARVVSVTPAPQYADHVDEQTKSRRVVLSKPLYTVQKVEVREHNHRLVEDIESDSVEPKVSEFEKLRIIGKSSTDTRPEITDQQVEYVTPVPQQFAHLRAGSPIPENLQK